MEATIRGRSSRVQRNKGCRTGAGSLFRSIPGSPSPPDSGTGLWPRMECRGRKATSGRRTGRATMPAEKPNGTTRASGLGLTTRARTSSSKSSGSRARPSAWISNRRSCPWTLGRSCRSTSTSTTAGTRRRTRRKSICGSTPDSPIKRITRRSKAGSRPRLCRGTSAGFQSACTT